MDCGKQVFYDKITKRFYIQHDNGVDCTLLDLSALRGRDGFGRPGAPGAAGPAGPAGAPGTNTINGEDEGAPVLGGPFSTINFIGVGVTASNGGGGTLDVTIPGGAGAEPQIFANALFVDAVFGNDATAVPFSLMDDTNNTTATKYQTILAARTAALLLGGNNVIIVYPGTYNTGATNIYANGQSYYLYAGVLLTSFIYGTTVGETCFIYGHGRINCAVDIPVNITDGYLLVECDDISAPGGGATIWSGQGAGVLDIFCNSITALLGRGIQMEGGTNTVNINVNGNITTRSDAIRTGIGGAFNGSANIKCNKIICTLVATNNQIVIAGGGSGKVLITADEIINNGGAGGPNSDTIIFYQMNGGSTSIVKIDADIISSSVDRRVFYSNGSSAGHLFEFTGDIFSLDAAILFETVGNALLATHKFNGQIRGINSTLGVGFEGVVITNVGVADALQLYLDGAIINVMAAPLIGNGIKQSTSIAPVHVLGVLKIITPDTGFAMASDLADTYKVIHSLARQYPNDVNFGLAAGANSIVGSQDYQDIGVQ